MFRFETLNIWQLSKNFSKEIYKLTQKFPREELYCLTDQLKRSSNSIGLNIAEGSASDTKADFRRFLTISLKSLFETVAALQIALDQRYISEETYQKLYLELETLSKKISAFKKTL